MGMAASQARHLALVARKSNCEYEGQQINQARTALANQSANLFNQMLGLEVPVPPSTQDFTKTQYSYNDGVNASTIDSWQQLANPEEEYNYVVTSHYYTDVYTGSQKKMSDPQVQFTSGGIVATQAEMTNTIRELTTNRSEYEKIKDEYEKIISNYENAVAANQAAQAAYEIALEVKNNAQSAMNTALTEYNTAKANSETYIADGSTYDNLKTAMQNAKTALDAAIENSTELTTYQNGNWAYTPAQTKTKNADGSYSMNTDKFVPYTGLKESDLSGKNITLDDIKNSISSLIEIGALPADFDTNNIYVTINDSTPAIAFKEDLDKALISTENYEVAKYDVDPDLTNSIPNKVTTQKNLIESSTTAYDSAAYNFGIAEEEYKSLLAIEQEKLIAYNNANAVYTEANTALVAASTEKLTAETNLANAQAAYDQAEIDYGPTVTAYENSVAKYESYQSPSYIGNCTLTLLENLTSNQQAELKQVIYDMTANGYTPAINSCFDSEGNYTGGIYQFKLNGITYYTTYSDLYESYTSGTGINNIDGQTKLAYYNSSYVSTKIEKTEKALLETDGNGRFVSVRFGDDSATYTLNMETITDDVAYQDAMNEYYYANAKYDKMVQDINAKTSIIQQEDQQLELRLKQLDTERTALSTEIEAVSKIVKENVESTFKTFNS